MQHKVAAGCWGIPHVPSEVMSPSEGGTEVAGASQPSKVVAEQKTCNTDVGGAMSESATTIAGGDGPSDWSTTTIAASFPDSVSDGSGHRAWRGGTEVIKWTEVRLGHRIEPFSGYAHCADDVHLLACFLELSELPDIDGDAVKLMLRTLKFLRLCDYSVEDLCSILAHASSYFIDAYALCGSQMDTSEVGNVLATLTFVAHCYCQDETCPLHVWHQHLFRKYCPLKTLNAAVVRLLQIRRYVLRLEEKDLGQRFATLIRAAHTTRHRSPLARPEVAVHTPLDRIDRVDRVDCAPPAVTSEASVPPYEARSSPSDSVPPSSSAAAATGGPSAALATIGRKLAEISANAWPAPPPATS